MQNLTVWCNKNNLTLNVNKTKEIIIDLKKNKAIHSPLLNKSTIQMVNSVRFLGVQLRLLHMDSEHYQHPPGGTTETEFPKEADELWSSFLLLHN